MTLRSPGIEGFGISMIERGASRLVFPGTHGPLIGNASTGLIYRAEPGIRATASASQSRLLVRVPIVLLRRKLEALLDGEKVESIAFQSTFDQTHGAGATIRRMVDFLFAELEHSDSLLTNEIAIRSFEENLAFCVLLGLPHNYSDRIGRQKAAAAPGNVRRAEAFMRANAETPLTIAEIAGSGMQCPRAANRVSAFPRHHPNSGVATGPAGTGANRDAAPGPDGIAGADCCCTRL
jgi:hypothetical protein